MAIIKPRPDRPGRPVPTPIISKPTYKHIAVDNDYQPTETLQVFVEGYPWTTETYYSQILGLDSPVAGQGLGTDPTQQAYKAIKAMEIRVTSPLTSPSQTESTGELGSTGAATLYPPLIPNKGDMFTADLLDGRLGVFEITNSTRLSIFRETCHSIEYKLVDFGASAARLADLIRKVVQTVFFEKDFVFHGQNPLLVSDDYENYQYLRRNYRNLISQYFKKFTSREYGTLIMPDQQQITYDGFLLKALLQHLSTNDAKEIQYLRVLNTDDDQSTMSDSIWTVLATRNRETFNDAFTKVGAVRAASFTVNPVFDGIRYSGMKQVIYPIDPMFRVDHQHTNEPKDVSPFTPTRWEDPRKRKLSSLIDATKPDESLTCIKNALTDGYYVFSKEFYENDRDSPTQSMLELCVQDYIDGKDIPYHKIRELVEASVKWDNVNSFYFIPVLIILVKSVIRSI